MNHTLRWSFIAALIVAAGVHLMSQDAERKSAVSVEEARRLVALDSTVLVLDVRTPEEFAGALGHIGYALLIPVQELEQRIGELEKYKDRTILAVCRTGRRSATATQILTKNGFRVFNVEGGMVRWNEKGFPVIKEK